MTVNEYLLPGSLDDALVLLEEHGSDMLVMGGGTVVMPLINGGVTSPDRVMGLKHAGLDYIRQSNNHLDIGAAVPLGDMFDLRTIPMLQEAARNTATWTVRNLGTVGGNLFVPPPAGDFAVALLALDAWLKFASRNGERVIPIWDFYTGFLSNVMEDGEILVEIQVPVPPGKTAYFKYGRKLLNTPSIVTVATHLAMTGRQVEQARIALNGVGPHPIRALNAESTLAGNKLDRESIKLAATEAAKECEPFSDSIASEWYRRKMVEVHVRRVLNSLIGKEG